MVIFQTVIKNHNIGKWFLSVSRHRDILWIRFSTLGLLLESPVRVLLSIHSWVNSSPCSPNIQPVFICGAAGTEGANFDLLFAFWKPSIGGRPKCITGTVQTLQMKASELGGSLSSLGGDMDTHREQRVCARTLSIIIAEHCNHRPHRQGSSAFQSACID